MDEQLDRITDLQQVSRIVSYENIESFYLLRRFEPTEVRG